MKPKTKPRARKLRRQAAPVCSRTVPLFADRWDLGFQWKQPGTFLVELLPRQGGDGPWGVHELRREIEDQAATAGLSVEGLFRQRRAEVQEIISRLVASNALTPQDCIPIANLLLMVLCRDPELPDVGRQHAMNLLGAVATYDRDDASSAGAIGIVLATWTALAVLGFAGVVDLQGWQPHDVTFRADPIHEGSPQGEAAVPPELLPN
jgi:hypothetical protein